MAEKIVESMFGLQPWQVQQQRQAQQYADANNYAQLDPFQRATAGMYASGAQLADIGAGMMGLEHPAVTQAKQQQAIMADGGMDMSPAGLRAKAEKFLQVGNLNAAFRLKQLADQSEATAQETALKKAQELNALREKVEPELKYATREEKLLAARNKYPQGSAEWKYFDDLLKASSISGANGGSKAKPKNLTREASLKWDLDHGLIDQETYNRAMLGTPGAKAQVSLEKEIKSFRVMDDKFKEIENAMADALGVPPEKLEDALTSGIKSSASTLESATGFIEGQTWFPSFSQNKQNILNHIERLKMLGETTGLSALRAAGVAPGTITEKEWAKFRADLAALDTTLDGKELAKQFYRIYQKIQDSRLRFQEDMSAIQEKLPQSSNSGNQPKWEVVK